jgi:autotransporter-associated beta strand protein
MSNAVDVKDTVTLGGDAPMTFGPLSLWGNTTLVVDADTTFGTVDSNNSSSGLTKTGRGALTIGVPGVRNTYSGPTIVTGGTLKLANGGYGAPGSFDQTSGYTVNNGALNFSAGGTNATLAVKLTGVSGTVVGSLNVKAAISGTNLTLGELKIGSSAPTSALAGTLDVGNVVYTGSQVIPAGTVIGGAGVVTVETGASLVVNGEVNKPFSVSGQLWGQGTIGGPVDVVRSGSGAALIGAGSVSIPSGTFTVGDLTLERGAELVSGIRSTNATTIDVNGTVTLGGALDLRLQATPNTNSAFVVINNDGADPVVGALSNLPNEDSVLTIHRPGVDYLFKADYHYDAAGDGADNDVALTVSAVPTPEPNLIAFLSLAPVLFKRRRDHRNKGSGAARQRLT